MGQFAVRLDGSPDAARHELVVRFGGQNEPLDRVRPGHEAPERGLDGREPERVVCLGDLDRYTRQELELRPEADCALHDHVDEARRVPPLPVAERDVLVDERLLPRDEDVLVHDQGVVLVETLRQRVVEDAVRGQLIGVPRQHLHPFGRQRDGERDRIVLVVSAERLDRPDHDLVAEQGARADHLRARARRSRRRARRRRRHRGSPPPAPTRLPAG